MSDTTELVKLSAAEMAAKVKTGEVSSRELVEAHLAVIDAAEPSIKAFLKVSADQALDQADAFDAKSADDKAALPELAGVPIAIKDMIVTKGIETTAASKILEGWVPPYDATVIEKLKAAGMPLLGKTNLDEFAQGSSTEHSAYQTTHNPWDTERVPGGSGGGSASAVAAFEAPIALGTDTGGSIRQPGALTGTVGVKPTYGGVSRFGAIAMASSLDQIGPVSRTVLDSALLQEIIGGHDKRDSTSIPEGPRPMAAAAREGLKRDLKGLKVGLIKELGGDGYQPGVEARFNEAVKKLEEMGAEVVEVSCPHFEYSLGAYYIIMPSEVSSNLARYDGMRYGLRVMPPTGVPQTAANMMAYTRETGFGDEVKRRIILGTYALSAGYYDAWYGSAQKVRTLIIQDFHNAFEKADVLVSPTSPSTAFKFGEKMNDPLAMYMNDIATIPANLAGVPAMSIPAGLSDDGLPVGFQFIAPQQRDEVMYKPAAALEAALEESWGGPIWQSLKTPWFDGLNKRRIGRKTNIMAEKLMKYADATKKYDVVFGLETHVELSTNTKLFCPAHIEFGGEPNTQLTPVSLGLPGSLPVINKTAVDYAIKLGLALHCEIAEWSQFARKNYFYPDMPRDYQISQYDKPTNGNGYLDVELEDGTVFRVPIERAHIEDDAGKNTHVGGADGRIEGADHSLVDYNRAGVPLIEIVTKPIEGAGDRAPEIAGAYMRAIRDIVRALNISHARMEQGNMRADVHVSLRPSADAPYGTRSETKNVNSFRGIEKTIQYEIRRQAARLDDGKEILQETRHWDEATQTTAGGRLKSDADDYRYFPDPDLVMLHITKEHIEEMKAQMPEMPRERRNRLKAEWGLSDLQMRDILNADALDLIEETVKAGAKAAGARKWWLGELSREANAKGVSLEELPITPADIAEVEKLIADGKLNDKLAKQTVEGVLKGEGTPDEVVRKHGYKIVEDNGAIEAAVDAAFEANPDVVEKLKSGNMKPMGVIIGAVMKATRGQADAKAVTKVVMGKIKG